MAKRLTNKQKYGYEYLHTYLVHIPRDISVKLKKDNLFDNFNKTYLNNILNNYNINKILEIVANKPNIKNIEIAISLVTANNEPNNNRVIEQIRIYPQSSELNDIEYFFRDISLSKHGIYKNNYNMDWKKDYGTSFCVSFVYIGLVHNNVNLYKLL